VCVYICGVSVFIGIIFELMLIKTHTYTPNRYYNIWVGIVSGLNNMFKTGKKENKEKKKKIDRGKERVWQYVFPIYPIDISVHF